jgi:hypothetical protein
MPAFTTIYQWVQQHPEFSQSLHRARGIAAHHYAEEAMAIADDDTTDVTPDGHPNHAAVQRARLRIEQRRWMAGKFNPSVYGDKVQHGPDGQSAIQEEHTYRFENLEPEELAELQRLLHKMRAPTIEG